ncbi:hypothetical protein DLM45_03885 [Hyphomicrobium methylovorum]|uniref:exo-alpha-sialidase n=1 Tax=Hyphomicrobium methylovorum TaxID=84 RepID=UPI0015E7BA29|nr:hypothetical protein [Hyphomicrobium methylovorum]
MTSPTTRTIGTWAAFVCSSVLIALLLYTSAPDNRAWEFADVVPPSPIQGTLDIEREKLTPPGETDFVHGPSIVATPTGLMAFWYRAVYEGAANAEIVAAHYENGAWSKAAPITNSLAVTSDIGIRIKSLANPVPFRFSENELWLFFSASRLSGWATCEILLMRSHDNGKTWGPAERLYGSPFLNMSHLTKSPPVRFADGRIGLPAYHEMNRKFPVMFILNENGRVIDRRRMGNGGKVGYQPMVVVTGKTRAIAFVRRLTSSVPREVLLSHTEDGGKTWSKPKPVGLPNPGAPLSAVRYGPNHILLAFNDDPQSELNVKLAISDLSGQNWQRIGTVEAISKESPSNGIMYPYLAQTAPGQFDIVFSRVDKTIDHARISSAWIEHHLQFLAARK